MAAEYHSDESGDIYQSLFFLTHCFYQRTITWSMLFFRRTIIPHKKVLQKGCEQILFFALGLILRRSLPPLHQHMRLTYCSPLRPILPPAPVYNTAVGSLSAPAYKRHPTHPSAPVYHARAGSSVSDFNFTERSSISWRIISGLAH